MPLWSRLYVSSCFAAAIVLYVALLDTSTLSTSSLDSFRNLSLSANEQRVGVVDNVTEISLDSTTALRGRPKIFTFYEHMSPEAKITGMSDAADKELLELWVQSWTEAGWDARVLSLDDARRHPDFEAYSKELARVSLGPRPLYDQLCYLRWLAMAAVGGGFMADFDVFPVRGTATSDQAARVQSDGKFVVYQKTERGNAVPGMASGSAAEWDRMAKMILEEGLKHEADARRKRPKIWSDMKSLIHVKDKAGYEIRDAIIKGQEISLDVASLSSEDCQKLSTRWAVHISHRAVEILNEPYESRPKIARKWLESYAHSCLTPNPNEQDRDSFSVPSFS